MMDPLTSAHKATDKKLARMEAHIRAIYRRAGKGLEEDAERILQIFAKQDAAKKAEVAAGALTNEDYLAWREGAYSQAMHKTRLADKLAKEAVNADKIAVAYVNGELPGIYALNINALNSTIKNTVGGYSFELLDAHTVRNLMVKYPNLLPLKKVAEKKVERWARSKIGSEILQGLLRGESIPKIAKRLQKVTGMQKKYAVTNARTAVTGAENKGRLDGMQEAEQKGVVLEKQWMATHDARTRDWHAELDGATANTDGVFVNAYGKIRYPGDPTADAANVYNCFVGDTKITTDSKIIRSYKHDYSGKLITIETSLGVKFSCTPNHPILTPRGWIGAELFEKGDDILIASVGQDLSLGVDPDIDHTFPRIDAIHKTLYMSGGDRTRSKMVNFHGDVPATDVEIITQKRLLGDNGDSCGGDRVDKLLFKVPDEPLASQSAAMQHFGRIRLASLRLIRGFCKALSFIRRCVSHSVIHRLGAITRGDSAVFKAKSDGVTGNVEFGGEGFDGFPVEILVDNVIDVKTSAVSHIPVYNLQTDNGRYFVNSIIPQNGEKCNGIFAIAHNCRCTLITHVKGFKGKNGFVRI